MLVLLQAGGEVFGITPFIQFGMDVKAEDIMMNHSSAAFWTLRVIGDGGAMKVILWHCPARVLHLAPMQ